MECEHVQVYCCLIEYEHGVHVSVMLEKNHRSPWAHNGEQKSLLARVASQHETNEDTFDLNARLFHLHWSSIPRNTDPRWRDTAFGRTNPCMNRHLLYPKLLPWLPGDE